MELLNDTPFPVAWIVGKMEPPKWSATVLVKGTFRIAPGGVATPEPEPLYFAGDQHVADDPARALIYPSDFVYHKPRADLLLVGTYHAPQGKPVDVGAATFRVGTWAKRLAVIGDREWKRFGGQTPPRPLKSLPISYERAYGGPAYERNPLGLGANDVPGPDGKSRRPLPNLESPEHLISNPDREAEPAAFAPIPGTWPQRMSRAGTYGKKWQTQRWPWFPEDFDWGYFNAAPADQQIAFLKGDEELVLENLHPAHSKYACRLPGLRPRCFLEERVKAGLDFREVPLKLDTLWVDADAERLILVWRGHVPVRSQELDEVLTLFAATEPLDKPPLSADDYYERFEDAEDRQAAEDEELEPEEEPEEEEEEEVPAEPEGPPEGEEEAPIVPPAADAAEPPEPEEPAEDELPEEPPPPTREELLARIARKESFAGADLTEADFREMDLSGIDFSEAILSGASLGGADLSGAKFVGAVMEEADLWEARAAGAVFAKADLARARLSGADLTGADLTEADLSDAEVSGAKLVRAVAPSAILAGADLSGTDFTEANLESADLSGCRLNGAILTKAVLTAASLEGAWGRGVRAEGAVVTKLKAADAVLNDSVFRKVSGEASVWQGARLIGCDFSGAVLPGAEFSSAHLAQATLTGGDFREGIFDEAILVRATAVRANFLGASLQKADLTLTDLREANLYDAICFDARTDDAILAGANLKMAKLGKGA